MTFETNTVGILQDAIFGQRSQFHRAVEDVFINKILWALANFMYYQYYFLSMMYSIDIYVMTCHPFSYSQFSSVKNMTKYLALGTAICLALNADSIIKIVVERNLFIYWGEETTTMFRYGWLVGFEITKLIKIFVVKIVYSITIVKIALKTRSALKDSVEMSPNERKSSLFRRLFAFTLIPLFLNFIYFAHDIMDVDYTYFHSSLGNWTFTTPTKVITTLSVFTLGSFIYFVGFIALFSNFRNGLVCKK